MYRVLMVEDQVAFLSKDILEMIGDLTIEIAKDGLEAIVMLDQQQYDLILLDLRLPRLPGFQVLEAIRKIDQHLPVVIVSAMSDKNTRARATELGANAFFAKPPDNRRLHAKIFELIAQQATQRTRLMQPELNIPALRQLLIKAFAATELRVFVYDRAEFRSLYDELSPEIGKGGLVTLILEYAQRRQLLPVLLAWCRETNPAGFEKFYEAEE